MKKQILFLTSLSLLTTMLLAGCTGQRSQPPSNQSIQGLSQNESSAQAKTDNGRDASNLMEFTREELAQYDGTDGKPAYVAVNGLVYDVTNNKGWRDGVHSPWSYKGVAGCDLTYYLSKAPASHRQKDSFANIPVVGRYTGPSGPCPKYEENK